MKALTPGWRSPRLPGLPSSLQRNFLTFHPQAQSAHDHRFVRHLQRDRLFPGFAIIQKARRYTPPKRVRFTTDRQFASGCSPPRLSANAVTFSYGAVTHPGTDFHRAVTRH